MLGNWSNLRQYTFRKRVITWEEIVNIRLMYTTQNRLDVYHQN